MGSGLGQVDFVCVRHGVVLNQISHVDVNGIAIVNGQLNERTGIARAVLIHNLAGHSHKILRDINCANVRAVLTQRVPL